MGACTSDRCNNRVAVYFSRGNSTSWVGGTLTDVVGFVLLTGDFNGDGFADLLIQDSYPPYALRVLLGDARANSRLLRPSTYRARSRLAILTVIISSTWPFTNLAGRQYPSSSEKEMAHSGRLSTL